MIMEQTTTKLVDFNLKTKVKTYGKNYTKYGHCIKK